MTTTENNNKEVTKDQLVKVLMGLTGSTFATITAETELKMNKKNNPYYGEVTKVTEANVNINFNYTNAVNNARLKEGNEEEFVAQPRKWGQKVPGTPLVLHEGNYYLEARFLGYSKTNSVYYHNNKVVEKTLLESFIPAVREAKNQDLENEVIVRSFKIQSIKEVLVNKTRYVVID